MIVNPATRAADEGAAKDATARADDALAQAVAAVEAVSSVEVVVALAARAEDYRDVPWKLGTLAGSLTLLALVYMPFEVTAGLGLMASLAVGAGAAWALGPLPGIVRRFSLARRRARAVEAFAKQVFVDQAVAGTRERTGILVLYCELEDRAEVLPDAGVLRRVAEAAFFPLEEAFHARAGAPEARLKALIEGLAPIVAGPLPRAEDDVNELPDAPRRL